MKYVSTFLVLFTVYILLAGFIVEEVLVGVMISLILTLLITKYVNYQVDWKLPYRIVLFLVIYLPVFIGQLILANLDIARRVLSVKIPLNPGFVKVETELEGDFAKLMLANSITLTPGTLSIDVNDQDLYIHTVDVKGKTAEENKSIISGLFEKILRRIFK